MLVDVYRPDGLSLWRTPDRGASHKFRPCPVWRAPRRPAHLVGRTPSEVSSHPSPGVSQCAGRAVERLLRTSYRQGMVDDWASWSAPGLADRGFAGFVPFADLDRESIPRVPGVYVVLRPDDAPPRYAARSSAGWFKGRDPTVPVEKLQSVWVDSAAVLYIGKATGGTSGRRGLRARLWEYRRFGFGEPVGHWGGRYIWQLENARDLLVAWMTTPDVDPADMESDLITAFETLYGARPFANRIRGRRSRPE